MARTNDYFDRLRTLWPIRSFRQAVVKLLQLSPEQMAQLRAHTEAGFQVDELGNGFAGLSPEDLTQVIPAVRELYEPRLQGASAEEVVDELKRLLVRDPEELPANAVNLLDSRQSALLVLLSARDAYDRRNWREITQRAGLPALQGVTFFVDLRVTTLGPTAGRLVPVVLARLDFDEPVGSLENSVVFQLPDSALTELRDALSRLEAAVDEVTRSLGDQIL